MSKPTRIGLVLKPQQNSDARNLLEDLCRWIQANGYTAVVLAEDQVNPPGAQMVPQSELGDSVDLLVVLGGDGTMLRASGLLKEEVLRLRQIPLLGINLGRLGFLSPYEPGIAIATLSDALSGHLPTTQRNRLDVTYKPVAGEPSVHCALNDVVISQGAMARLVELQAYLDGCFINSYRADGLVICSPTGSTAYNLAAGGPIVYPGLAALTITPICAQGLTNRPLVVGGESAISISISGESHGVVLTIDGHWAHGFHPGDEVVVRASEVPLTVFGTDDNYFNILRAKLHWGVAPIDIND